MTHEAHYRADNIWAGVVGIVGGWLVLNDPSNAGTVVASLTSLPSPLRHGASTTSYQEALRRDGSRNVDIVETEKAVESPRRSS